MDPNAATYATVHAKRTLNVTLSLVVQVALLLFVVGVVLWAVLFTQMPATHDFFHELRHGLFLIPCH
jgi:hypothetical protein